MEPHEGSLNRGGRPTLRVRAKEPTFELDLFRRVSFVDGRGSVGRPDLVPHDLVSVLIL